MNTEQMNPIPECRPLRSKAPEDWRSPKPDGLPSSPGGRKASWTAVAPYRFSFKRAEAGDKVSPVVLSPPAPKAPEDWRTPKPGGLPSSPGGRKASWTAVALYRFSPECDEPENKVSPVTLATPAPKAPEDWRTPKPGGLPSSADGREASWTAVAPYRFLSSPKKSSTPLSVLPVKQRTNR